MVVDDDAAVRRVLCAAINWIGLPTLEAGDGEEAFQLYLRERPALVISDVYMPKMNGIQLLRTIRRYEPDARVVLITGSSHFAQLAEDQDSRPDGYLEKPFQVSDLIGFIHRLTATLPNRKAAPAAQLSHENPPVHGGT